MATSIKRSKGSESSLRIGTYSFWIKLTTVGGFNVYSNTVESDNNRGYFQFTSDNKWRMVDNDTGGTNIQLRTNRLFRDFNAWYHIVVRVDTTQATSTDRVRLYVNGVQETSFDQTDYPAQNDDLKIFEGGQTDREYMNMIYGGSAQSPNFYLSHFHYTDGQSYGPDTFGSTDSTTGQWKINTDTSVTYGNEGFFMFKDDASLNDDSGNNNDWTSDSGTIQKSEDNPSNVFATWNPLNKTVGTFSNGNLSCTTTTGEFGSASTLGFSQGKYYAEFKVTGSNYLVLGVADENGVIYSSNNNTSSGKTGATGSIGFPVFSGVYRINNSNTSYGSSFAQNDIASIAIDCDNQKIYLGKNGTWQNSADPVAGTGGIDVSSVLTGTDWFFTTGDDTNTLGSSVDANFGNGYFGTTAITSEGTNASGIGKFEYDVPTGYTALSTRGLNE